MYKGIIAAVALVGVTTGCSTMRPSSIQVVKDPDPRSDGIRFYRPKPYLLITPADPTGRMVSMKLDYLPDYGEGEYLVKVRGNAKVALKDGWNLVGVNTEGPPPEPAPPAGAPPAAPDSKLPPIVVAATNVPIGYYESVVEPVGSRKVFRGWRYVGFGVLGGGTDPGDPRLPICGHTGCPPTNSNGQACRNPAMPQPVFGLVSVNGVMTFREIGEIAMNNGCPFYVETPSVEPAPTPKPQPITGTSGGGNGGASSGAGASSAEPAQTPAAVKPFSGAGLGAPTTGAGAISPTNTVESPAAGVIPSPPNPNQDVSVSPNGSAAVKPSSLEELSLPPLPLGVDTVPAPTVSNSVSVKPASTSKTPARVQPLSTSGKTKSTTVGSTPAKSVRPASGSTVPSVSSSRTLDTSTTPTGYQTDYSTLYDAAHRGGR